MAQGDIETYDEDGVWKNRREGIGRAFSAGYATKDEAIAEGQHQTLSSHPWWEGRGSKARQFLQLTLEANPAYRLARLSDLTIGSGMVAGWNMDKDRAFRPWGLEAS